MIRCREWAVDGNGDPKASRCVVRGTDEAVSENVVPSWAHIRKEMGYAPPEKEWKVSKGYEITRCDRITDLGRKGKKGSIGTKF